MIKMIRRLIGEDISLSFNEAPETLPINADAGQIEQVLLNLCVNARDAMPEGGRITIETERAELDAGYCELHPEAKPGRYVAISVSDTGCGIAPEIRARVFEPFFTTKEVGRGTGLGLATVYAIVQRHGGCINLYSEVGIGTTFRVYLPLIEATPVSDLDGKSQGLELFRGKGETILVAEDDEQVLSITSRILNLANYRVISARDGEQVLEIYKQKAQEIRMVILDVVMPKLNGRQTYDSLKRSAPDLPIIFATGYSYHHLQDQIIEQEQILRKPFTPRELLSKVQNSLLPKARPQENHAADIQDQEVSSAL
jgi:CheY-like chemotaxis protein